MSVTVDELAFIVDSALDICLADEDLGTFSLRIVGAQLRVGAGPELQDVVGLGSTPAEAREDYADKIRNRVLVVGGNPRGFEIRIPDSVVGATGP